MLNHVFMKIWLDPDIAYTLASEDKSYNKNIILYWNLICAKPPGSNNLGRESISHSSITFQCFIPALVLKWCWSCSRRCPGSGSARLKWIFSGVFLIILCAHITHTWLVTIKVQYDLRPAQGLLLCLSELDLIILLCQDVHKLRVALADEVQHQVSCAVIKHPSRGSRQAESLNYSRKDRRLHRTSSWRSHHYITESPYLCSGSDGLYSPAMLGYELQRSGEDTSLQLLLGLIILRLFTALILITDAQCEQQARGY